MRLLLLKKLLIALATLYTLLHPMKFGGNGMTQSDAESNNNSVISTNEENYRANHNKYFSIASTSLPAQYPTRYYTDEFQYPDGSKNWRTTYDYYVNTDVWDATSSATITVPILHQDITWKN